MTIKEKLEQLEDLLDMEKDTLRAEDELEQLDEWDSMAIIALIAMFDDSYGKILKPKEVRSFKTIKDILDLME